MAKRGGLGRGLDALIPKKETAKASSKESEKAKEIEETEYSDEEDLEEETTQSVKGRTSSKQEAANKSSSSNTGLSKSSGDGIPTGDVISMRISKVEPNRDQPRKYFDDTAIEELADSVRQFGIIQPLLVQKKDDYYEIIAGERRWRAAQKAGLKEVPVIVKTFSNQEAVEVSLIENIQREDLNPIEEAKAYERLVKEYGLSQEAVAGRVSKSRSAVANSMRLLKLNEAVQSKVETGELSEGHARAILGVADEDGGVYRELLHQVLDMQERLHITCGGCGLGIDRHHSSPPSGTSANTAEPTTLRLRVVLGAFAATNEGSLLKWQLE